MIGKNQMNLTIINLDFISHPKFLYVDSLEFMKNGYNDITNLYPHHMSPLGWVEKVHVYTHPHLQWHFV
jgi:hypothetical protein